MVTHCGMAVFLAHFSSYWLSSCLMSTPLGAWNSVIRNERYIQVAVILGNRNYKI